jgi:hypothetical protein
MRLEYVTRTKESISVYDPNYWNSPSSIELADSSSSAVALQTDYVVDKRQH